MEIKEVPLQQMCVELRKSVWSGPTIFIGDIGGTNARLGFARRTSNDGVSIVVTRFHMNNSDIMDVVTFLHIILKKVPASVVANVKAGVLSVPGPVTGGVVGGPFNNLKGLARLTDYPPSLFPKGRSVILNDLEAGGFGVLAASDAHVFSECFELMWEGSHWSKCEKAPAGSVLGKGRCVVLAPGTGLGSSLICYNELEKQHNVLPLELGSATLTLRDDNQYVEDVAKKLGRQPCYEEMVSGRGLEAHYTNLVGKHKLTAAEIAKLACQGDPNAVKAVQLFNLYLMRLGSEAAMMFIPLTVILVGDNIAHNAAIYSNSKNLEMMKREALNHAMERFGFQSRPTYLRQKKVLNLNLLGCYRRALVFLKKEKPASKL